MNLCLVCVCVYLVSYNPCILLPFFLVSVTLILTPTALLSRYRCLMSSCSVLSVCGLSAYFCVLSFNFCVYVHTISLPFLLIYLY